MGDGEDHDQLLTRLGEADLDEGIEDLVLAAALGQGELGAALGGERPARPVAQQAEALTPDRAYLSRITVCGFRGIGATSTMTLSPGPGVTLVVGRNGSGKSTFAEAAEMALSGESSRWVGKSSVLWRAGWANAHHHGSRRIGVRLHREGVAGHTRVERRWEAADTLDGGVGLAQTPGGPEQPLASLSLANDISLHRPFLSYDELGGLWSETPSARHDRLNALLGLEDWSEVDKRLKDAARTIAAERKEAEAQAKTLAARVAAVDDPRADAVSVALAAKGGWCLDDIEEQVTGTAPTDPALAALQALTTLSPPSTAAVSEVAARLRSAADGLDGVAGGAGARAAELADLLGAALDHHDHDAGSDCPVCGASGRLDEAWAAATRERVAELRAEAEGFRVAHREADTAQRQAGDLVRAVPPSLTSPSEEVAGSIESLAPARQRWERWASVPEGLRPLADHLEAEAPGLCDAVVQLREEAGSEVVRRQDRWRPVAEAVAGWVPAARRAQAQKPQEKQLKAAARWVGDAAREVRAERFAPIAAQVREVWEQLRRDSNVSVDGLALDGAATHRRLEVAVSVDDAASDAGVALLSQGELHALSLALFLPRATRPESPFRFVLIDDPVQAMDGSRVDGLVRVLEQVGRERQVVVFTHDERLPDAFRSLGVDAKVLEVRRGKGSEVNVGQLLSPAERYLDDARAIASTDPFPEAARDRVVPGLCRRAVEATAIDLGRARLLGEGRPFDEVEARVLELKKLRSHLAFALFGDADRHNDVDESLRPFAARAVPTMIKLNQGSHEGIDAHGLVDDTRLLVEGLHRRLG